MACSDERRLLLVARRGEEARGLLLLGVGERGVVLRRLVGLRAAAAAAAALPALAAAAADQRDDHDQRRADEHAEEEGERHSAQQDALALARRRHRDAGLGLDEGLELRVGADGLEDLLHDLPFGADLAREEDHADQRAEEERDIMTGQWPWCGIIAWASSRVVYSKRGAALHSVESLVVVVRARHMSRYPPAEAEEACRVAGRAVGLRGVGVDGAHVDQQRGEAADRRDEPLVGGLLLHLRALRRAEPHEVVGAVVVDVRQGPEVGAVVREGALPVRFERSPGASPGASPWGLGGGGGSSAGLKMTLTDTFGLRSAA